jgi:hypothetical protein
MAEPIRDVFWGFSLRNQHRYVSVPEVVGCARTTDRRLYPPHGMCRTIPAMFLAGNPCDRT